ncbi:MAG: hypothetical protein HUK40_09540 [Desulfobacter sp.]|nr:hypothetical protein [Desulfobacter sp.]
MDAFLDRVWAYIESGLESLALGVDHLISPLESFGPGWVIFILAVFTAGFTRMMVFFFRTRRHAELEKEFLHWKSVREAAMKTGDREKGKAMAKNIDQAKLNKVYYDSVMSG